MCSAQLSYYSTTAVIHSLGPSSRAAPHMSSTRYRVLALYKELHRLGRDYPDPKYFPPLYVSYPFRKLTSGERPTQLRFPWSRPPDV